MILQFWQGWSRSYRIFFFIFSGIFAAALIWMWASYFIEPSPTIHLQTITEAEINEIPVDQFSKGPFSFIVKGNNYVILQRQLGGLLSTSETVDYVYLLVLAVFVIGMLAVISTLGRFYYLVCMGIFIVFVTTLSTELLGVFGSYGKTFSIVIMSLYGFASFYFFYFASNTSFTVRILVFTGITIFLWLVINFLSEVEKPFLHIATYGGEAGLIACGLFIITVSHEIVAAFVFAVTQNPRTTKSLNHFLIISVIYLINLALTYSVYFGFIKWNIITVDIFLLLSISGILGIWGIRQRQKTYEGVIDADPFAVLAFLITGAFAFATIAMFMMNANDTAIAAISDVIIFTHIGFGLIFLMYVFSNFGGMLAQNYQVYKVLYQSNNMPYFSFRLAGLITALAFAFYNTFQIPVNNSISGYYNGLGDLYSKLNNIVIAKAYYEEARTRGYHGHHANYALANIEGSLFNASAEHKFYDAACGPRPTQMSYLNLAQTYQVIDENTEAIDALKEGMKKLKSHDALENTLSMLYAKSGMPDSAIKYLSKSNPNTIGLAALGQIGPIFYNDSIQQLSNDPLIRVNQLALLNRQSKTQKINFELPKDTVLTLAEAASICNYLVTDRKDDTTFVKQVISLARRPSNDGFKEAILFSSAISLYNSGETRAAFTTLEEVTVTSQHQGRYNNILAMWALENDEPQRASSYADYGVSQNYEPAKPTYAVTLTESGKLNEALAVWDSIRVGNDSISAKLATRIRNALVTNTSGDLTDDDKYVFARYRLGVADSSRVFQLITTMTDDNLKAKTLLDLAQKLYLIDKPSAALNSLQRIVGLELTDASIGNQMQILELLARNRADVVAALKQNPVAFKGKEKKYKIYFDALTAEAAGDSTKANVYYKWLGNEDPFFDDGVIAAANYFKNKGDASYNILAEARLYHPTSLRILKAYALESARQGYEDYAMRALETLRPLISAKDHLKLSDQVKALFP